MDRRFFLRSLVAAAGAAALVPVLGLENEAMAAPRAKADVKPVAPADTLDADVPAEGATESQYFYYRRPRYYYRPRYVYRRPRYYYRPRYVYRRRFYRRRFW
ncbi:hypothetical protein PY365_33265 [Roseiarcaceae bacterium H3SJ34-1]|uniref:hypothetical protein n=1 Tax=Terripilifer ovatus TaxID=3032367 RepID=UPI003AB98F14|nr:hypothetical protein [Roseiarcaceae bacterium H3SJ34-1]